MYRYRRRIAMLSVGAQLGCPVRRRIEGEIEIARPVEIVFETTRSHTPTRFFFSRVLQPFVVNLLGKTVYQDMRRNGGTVPGLLDNVIFFGALVLGAVINTALISLVVHAMRRRRSRA